MNRATPCLLLLAAGGCVSAPVPSATTAASSPRTATAVRRDVDHVLRLHGTVEAESAYAVIVPRILGQNVNALVVTALVSNGTRVKAGDLLVEFDRQAQLDLALEKKAEFRDLDEQVRKTRAELDEQRAKDDTALTAAENALALARLEVAKNEVLPRIEAEKNQLLLEAATAELAQLRKTYALKRAAAQAQIRTLEVRRDRARREWQHAESNAERLSIRSPVDGMAVLRTVWKGGRMGEPQDGEEVRPGLGLLDVVADGAMRIRVKVNQTDLAGLRPGMSARVTLDAYPSRHYEARLERLAPVATSGLADRVRSVLAYFTVEGRDAMLTPDLSASVDVTLGSWKSALTIPREAVRWRDGEAGVRTGGEWRPVTLDALTGSEAVIARGLDEGTEVELQTDGAV